jgi:uncharacterized glyoxalase superfamily protein PhnB
LWRAATTTRATKYGMKLNRVVPLLWTTDLDKTISFYQQMLGFDCVNRIEGWAVLKKDEVELMLSLPNAHEPFDKIQLTGSFYFHPDNVDELWQQLKDKATIVYPLEDFTYGMREFAIRDNNGYILQFGQEI